MRALRSSDSDESFRRVGLAALKSKPVRQALADNYGTSPVVDQLLNAIESSSDQTRRAAAVVLPFFKDTRCASALVKALRDPVEGVRRTVASRIGEARLVECIEALREAAKDPSEDVRNAVANALGAMQAIIDKYPICHKCAIQTRPATEEERAVYGQITLLPGLIAWQCPNCGDSLPHWPSLHFAGRRGVRPA